MTDILGWFFSLGNRVTKGDPKLLLDWNFYLLCIMFMAFFTILLDNLYQFFFISQRFTNLGWAFVMVAILWFQYQALAQTYQTRKMYKNLKPEKIENEKAMLDEFNSPQLSEGDKKEVESLTPSVDDLSKETKKAFNKELKGGDAKNE